MRFKMDKVDKNGHIEFEYKRFNSERERFVPIEKDGLFHGIDNITAISFRSPSKYQDVAMSVGMSTRTLDELKEAGYNARDRTKPLKP